MAAEHPYRAAQRCPATARFAALAMLVAAALAPTPAPAQINPFARDYDLCDLTGDDIQLMMATAAKLRASDATPLGQSEAWTNPPSGSSGTVTLLQRFQRRDLPCQKIRHTFRDKRHPDPSSIDLDVCRLPSGDWKVGF